MTRPNPLTDELSDEVKADLARRFKVMRASFHNFDAEQQRFINRVWNIRDYRLP